MLKIFLSSTYRYLNEFWSDILNKLDAVFEGIDMEKFIPDRETSHEDSIRRLKTSDIVVFLISPHYESLIDTCDLKDDCAAECPMKTGEGHISHTHCEFKTTIAEEKHHLIYKVLDGWDTQGTKGASQFEEEIVNYKWRGIQNIFEPQAFKKIREDLVENIISFLAQLGVAYQKSTKFEEAVILNREALKVLEATEIDLEPDLPTKAVIQYNLGLSYWKLARLDEAISVFLESLNLCKKLIDLNSDEYTPKVAIIEHNLGLIYWGLKKFEEAIVKYTEALKIFEKLAEGNPETFLEEIASIQHDLGGCYWNLEQLDNAEMRYFEAIKIYQKLGKENPDRYFPVLIDAQNMLGAISYTLKKYEEAESRYLDSLNTCKLLLSQKPDATLPQFFIIKCNLGLINLNLKRYEEAELYFDELLKDSPKDPNIWFYKACLESLRNDKIKSIKFLKQAIELDKKILDKAKDEEDLQNIRDSEEFTELFISKSPSKITNQNIGDLLNEMEEITFLVGAGISVDAPSHQPAGRAMMDTIIDYTCDESEIEGIKDIKELRFEALIEIVRDRLDNDLRIIDFYGLCDKPNLQHFYIADMIMKGQFVLTTNFDFLIEHALQQIGISDDKIVPVITRDDFEKYYDPHELIKQGKYPIYKIHGSTKNIITGDDTKDYLITTIQAFGSNKDGLNVFQIEPFKRPLFDNITRNRSLVVMGYSGSDDFDVVPTLKILQNLKNLIWLNYKFDDEGHGKIYEIEDIQNDLSESMDKINEILISIKNLGFVNHVYRVDVNTSKLIEKLIKIKPKLSLVNIENNSLNWLKEKVPKPDNIQKLFVTQRIYQDYERYDDAIRCINKIIEESESSGDKLAQSLALNYLGNIYFKKGDYPKANMTFRTALEVSSMDGSPVLVEALTNLATVQLFQENYDVALIGFEESLRIYEKNKNLQAIASCIKSIGDVYYKRENYEEAIKKYKESLKMYDEFGDLLSRAMVLNNMGIIYMNRNRYSEALEQFEEALQINNQLGSLSGKAIVLGNIGRIHFYEKRYSEALKFYQEALMLNEKLRNYGAKASILDYLGELYKDQGNFSKALGMCDEALMINIKLNDSVEKASTLILIGEIHSMSGYFVEARDNFKKALETYKQLENKEKIANCHRRIGDLLFSNKNYEEALNEYKAEILIWDELGEPTHKIDVLNIVSVISSELNLFQEAIEKAEEVMQLAENIGYLEGKVLATNNLASIYYSQKDSRNALLYYGKAYSIYEKLEYYDEMGEVLLEMGAIYKQLDEIPDAVEQFQKILEIKDKIKNDSTKIVALNVLANIYNDQGDLRKTEPLLEQLLGIYEKQEDFIEQGRILSNLGMTNLEKGDYINALSYFKTGLQFFIKQNDLERQGYLHTNIGDTYKLTKNFPAALKHYEKALDIAEKTANLELREFCLNNLGLFQSDLNDYDKLISYLEGMLAILTEKGLGDSQIARNLKDQIEETKSKLKSKKRT
ncbi:MAG: tetratricopeptide repeat protein [Candidatus Thorarchaeota archaeon]